MHPHFSFVSSVLFYVSPAFFYASSVLCFRFLRALLSFPPQKRGPGPAMAPLPRSGPQRSGFSAGTMPGFPPRSFPPRKRGPRNRGGAAVAERSSAQWALRRHDVRVVLKRKHAPCRGSHDGSMSFWLPSRVPWRSEEHTSELQSRGHLV